jgi:DNA-binding LacI/PurR family transcriptional regulator
MDKVTINDVAKAAGVAKSTVSRILNDRPGVNPLTRHKVLEIIEKLNFSPNIIARSLKTNQRKQIALAIDDIRNPYFPELAWAAEQVAHRYGYRILVVNHYGRESEELAVIEDSNEMHVGGIILMSLSYPKGLKRVIKKSKIPVSLIGGFEEDMPADMVYLSQSEGNLAMDHLIRIGRARIAYAGGPKEMHLGTRFAAYVNALSSNLMKFDESLVYIGNDFTLQTGLDAAQYYSSLKQRPDAIYAGNDLIAIGLLHGFDELGIRVPEDVALIGIDDIKWSVITKPKISSVSNLSTEMARISVEMLMDRLENGKTELPYRRVMLEPRLIVRDSSLKLY